MGSVVLIIKNIKIRVSYDGGIVGVIGTGYETEAIDSALHGYGSYPTLSICERDGNKHAISAIAGQECLTNRGPIHSQIRQDRIWRISRLPDTCRECQQNKDEGSAYYLFHYAKKLKIEAFIAILAKNFFAKNAKGYRISPDWPAL